MRKGKGRLTIFLCTWTLTFPLRTIAYSLSLELYVMIYLYHCPVSHYNLCEIRLIPVGGGFSRSINNSRQCTSVPARSVRSARLIYLHEICRCLFRKSDLFALRLPVIEMIEVIKNNYLRPMQLIKVLWIILQPVIWPINLPQLSQVLTDYLLRAFRLSCLASNIYRLHLHLSTVHNGIIRSTSFIIAYFPFQVHKWPIVGVGYQSTPNLITPSYPIAISFWGNVPRYIIQSRASSIFSNGHASIHFVWSPPSTACSAHFASTSRWASIASFSHQSTAPAAMAVLCPPANALAAFCPPAAMAVLFCPPANALAA
jgi:hypothetical protein